jgi:hypothetical protein
MNIRNPFADLSVNTDDEAERINKPTAVSNSTLPSTIGEKKRKRKVRPEEKQRIEEEKINKIKEKVEKVKEEKVEPKTTKVKKNNDDIEVIVQKAEDFVDLESIY